jgi:hypothetical protein
MKKIIKLTESDLTRIIKRVISESQPPSFIAVLGDKDYPLIGDMGESLSLSQDSRQNSSNKVSGTWSKKPNMKIVLKTSDGEVKELTMLGKDKPIYDKLPAMGKFMINMEIGARNSRRFVLYFYK